MKNLFKNLMLVAVAAMAFTSCNNEDFNELINGGIEQDNTVTMTFVADAPESRTSVAIEGNTAKYSWSEGDRIGLYYVDVEGVGKKKVTSKDAIITGSQATFTASLEKIEEASTYNIGAFYPSDSWTTHANDNPFNNVKVKIPATQTLTVDSFDPKADLMMSKPFMGVTLDSNNTKTLEFTRIAAIGKMNLKLDGMQSGEKIQSVKFSLAQGTLFNGNVLLDLEDATYELLTDGASNYVSLGLTGDAVAITANTAGTPIYFTCFPGKYTGAYTIEVETDKATYSKTATIAEDKALTFTAGNVLNFNATVGGRKAKEVTVWSLVTDVADLKADDNVIIAAKDSNFAMSTTQNSNNRGQATITKSGNTISTPGSTVQIFTLKNGAKDGTFAFYTGSGYIHAASSSSNYLRTQTTNDANASWKITLSGDGAATIVAQGTYTRNVMQYNQSSSLFACYVTASQKAVAIYKKYGSASGGEQPEQPETPTDPDPETPTDPDQPSGDSVTESLNIYANKGSLANKVITWNGTNFTFSNAQGSSATTIRTSDTDHYRIYQGSDIKFTASNGKKFTKIVITCTSNDYATALKNTLGESASASGTTVTWTGSAETITANATKQSRINKIEATLQ